MNVLLCLQKMINVDMVFFFGVGGKNVDMV